MLVRKKVYKSILIVIRKKIVRFFITLLKDSPKRISGKILTFIYLRNKLNQGVFLGFTLLNLNEEGG